MRILVCSQNFSPELTGIGKYSGDMAAWLAARGHEVRVVCAPPYYPHWRVEEGFRRLWYQRDAVAGARVTRCPIWVPRCPSGLTRLLHLASFAVTSLPVLLGAAFWRPDVVWVVAPAIFSAPGALLAARLGGARTWLHIQDYEIDAAFGLGLLRGERKRRMVTGVERWLLRRFDVVSSISTRLVERAVAKGVARSRSECFPNWADLKEVDTTADPTAAIRGRRAIGLPEGPVIALYSGNMGNKQGLEVLADIARRLPAIAFVLCGAGAGRRELQDACAGLPNVRFLDLQPPARYAELLAAADIHLLPMRADALDSGVPSKLTAMLASGRPVVATANAGTELARTVNEGGIAVPAGDSEAMARAVSDLAADNERRRRLGDAGRRYAEMHLGRDAILGAFESRLLSLLRQ
jgi:colanic acid biosynthesis glycosyl transferase WcaI